MDGKSVTLPNYLCSLVSISDHVCIGRDRDHERRDDAEDPLDETPVEHHRYLFVDYLLLQFFLLDFTLKKTGGLRSN